MDISKKLITREEFFLILAACALPVYSWSIYWFLERVQGWLFYLDSWEIVSIFAYTQALALLESGLLALLFVLLAMLLPTGRNHKNLVAIAVGIALLTVLWIGLIQFNDQILRQSSLLVLGAWGVAYLLSVVLLYVAILRWQRLSGFFRAAAERISVLLYIYLPLSFAGLVIVLVRNFF